MLQLNQGPARHFELFQHRQVDTMLLKFTKCEVAKILNADETLINGH